MNDELSMLNTSNASRRTSLFLITIGLILFVFYNSAVAAQLLDIRVGEYDGFTRIVYELDAPFSPPRIEQLQTGQLMVVFENTALGLVRKIPVERSRHIKDLQLWQRDGNVSTILNLDYPNFRFETFPLTNPPRAAIDIFPLAASMDTKLIAPVNIEKSAPQDTQIPIAVVEPKPPPANNENDDTPSQALETEGIEPETPVTQETPAPPKEIKPPTMPKLRVSTPDEDESPPPSATHQEKKPVRLQFFLVIGLVVITIGILFLLLLMLFSRHRLLDKKSTLTTRDFLLRQDKKIAALDSRIKEQIKQYDET